MNRPDSFGFAMDFLGGPEADELLAYIQALEKARSDCFEPELSDVKAYLSAIDMAAVPLEPTEARINAGISENQESCGYDMGGSAMTALYKAMIAAQGEE
jgi:hypothetical protein